MGTEAVNLLFLLRTSRLFESRMGWIREGGIKYENVTESNGDESELDFGLWKGLIELASGLMVKVSLIEEGDPVRVPSRSVPSQISPDFGAFLGNNNQILCRNGEERGAYSEWVSELEFRLGACAPHPSLCSQPFRGQTLASQSQFNPGALPLNCTDTWASDSPLSSIRKGKCSLLSRSIQIVVRQAGFLQIKWVLEILLLCLNLWECILTLCLLVPFHVAVSQTSHIRRVENLPCEYRKSSRPHASHWTASARIDVVSTFFTAMPSVHGRAPGTLHSWTKDCLVPLALVSLFFQDLHTLSPALKSRSHV